MNRALVLRSLALAAIALALAWAVQDAFSSHDAETPGILTDSEKSRAGKSRTRSVSRKRSRTGFRSFEEILTEWQGLIPSNGESLFEESEMSEFLSSLSEVETVRLAQHLLARNSYPKLATARLLGRWGEFDAPAALAALEDNQKIYESGRLHIYAGWMTTDAEAATARLAKERFTGQREIWRTIARIDLEGALDLLTKHSALRVGEEPFLLKSEARDSVFGVLPDSTRWQALADRFSSALFLEEPGGILAGVIAGPGPTLFTRWADHDVTAALDWYQKFYEGSHSSENFEQNRKGELIANWDIRSPAAVDQWIDGQLNSGMRENMLAFLDRQIGSHVSEKQWLERAVHLPNEQDRYELLLAGVRSRYEVYRQIGPLEELSHRGFTYTKRDIENLIVRLEITPEHAAMVRSAQEQRTQGSNGDQSE